MPVPTVKTDPFEKGRRRRRGRSGLWPSSFWSKLVDAAKTYPRITRRPGVVYPVGGVCGEMIGDMNLLLYGKR